MTEKIIETINIPVYKKDYLEKAIAKINRKAVKMGCDPLSLSFDNPHEYRTSTHPFTGQKLVNPIVIEMVSAHLNYVIPQIKGYELIAKLDIFSGDGKRVVLVSPVPEKTVPEKWLNATSIKCDHCNKNRYRTHSVLLRNVDSDEYKEVGSTCVKDFFGLDPKGFMFMASIKFDDIVGGISDEKCAGDGRVWGYDLESVLSITSAVIEKFGWTSRSTANNNNCQSTSDHVWDNLSPYIGMPQEKFVSVNNNDREKAGRVIEYFKTVDPKGNEYLSNLVKIVELGYVPSKYMGYACSMIVAYEKAMSIEHKKVEKDTRISNYVGEVGKRLKNVKVEVIFERNVESNYGTSTLYAFKDTDGNVIKTFYSGYNVNLNKGDIVLLTGTVKKHVEYEGEKQTMVNRILVKEVEE
jgi:hypothetical protein